MNARLTARGLALVATLAVFIAAGLTFHLPALTALGALGLSLLPAAWVAARSARDTLATCHLAWPALTRASLGRPTRLTLTMGPGLSATSLSAEPAFVGPLTLSPSPLRAPDLTCKVTAHRLGDAFIHGVVLDAEVALGLLRVRLYRPLPLTIQTVPFRLRPALPDLAPATVSLDASDLATRDRRGFGMEVRELRDFAPGDPFKHIAWKASARRNKLIVREFESELQRRIWLLIDASPSMFTGPVGRAPIDAALAIATELIGALANSRDEVGLIVHDHTVRAMVEPARGEGHGARLLTHLLEVPHLLHEDRTEPAHPEVLSRLEAFFLRQHGTAPTDERSLIAACRHALSRHRPPPLGLDAYAPEPDRSLLRAYARVFGVPLPLDPTPRPHGQAEGLLRALEALVSRGGRGSGATLLAITDLATADAPDTLKRVARLARQHRHSLVFAMPEPPPTEPPEASQATLAAALDAAETARIEAIRAVAAALLRPAGATFVRIDGHRPAQLLARLRDVA